MKQLSKSINIETEPNGKMFNITDSLQHIIDDAGLKEGIAVVFCQGSTGALSTVEYEPGLVKDLPRALERLAPADEHYEHHLTWGDDNGPGHIKATLIGPHLTIPFSDGRLSLGQWQQAVFIECDTRKRKRNLLVKLLGE